VRRYVAYTVSLKSYAMTIIIIMADSVHDFIYSLNADCIYIYIYIYIIYIYISIDLSVNNGMSHLYGTVQNS